MSLAAMVWALHEADVRNPGELAVLLALADKAWDDGTRAYPAQVSIAEAARISTATVQRILPALEERGVIRRGDQSLVEHFRYRPVVWDLAMPAPGRAGRHPSTLDVEAPQSEAPRIKAPHSVDQGPSPVMDNPTLTQIPPPPPAPRGVTCPKHPNTPGANCRRCGTTARQLDQAEKADAVERRRLAAAAELEHARRLRDAVDCHWTPEGHRQRVEAARAQLDKLRVVR